MNISTTAVSIITVAIHQAGVSSKNVGLRPRAMSVHLKPHMIQKLGCWDLRNALGNHSGETDGRHESRCVEVEDAIGVRN